MARESFRFYVKTKIVEWLVHGTPKTCPSFRDANIQIAKLSRMAADFDKKSSRIVDAKRKGATLRRLHEQSAKVDKLLVRLMVEQNSHLLGQKGVTVKKLRASCRMYINGLNDTIHQVHKQVLLTRETQKFLN